ncbi:MAG: SEL1-like repeat protein [Gammaproteobacteria bacterium]|nr:SEL1-like repeat protein [Gammaproteobacteria bacterium]MBU1724976.1 SEL1-like repeat protein [Gammaproteobacteria bacterium]MBU2006030.1 SEL1-like repeat protein [Gammaproteobacteria bacterium]
MGIELENALKPDSRLESFVVQEVLGAGGFGITYKAYAEHLGAYVAIKEFFPVDNAVRKDGVTVAPRSSKDQEFFQYGLDAFKEEARTLARFAGHPNIVHVYHYLEANGTAYMVMQYEQGQTFGQWLQTHPTPSQEQLLTLLIPVLDGLREVHKQNYLHRDIKPDNIYIRSDGRPLLIDFGSARQTLGSRSRSLAIVLSEGYAPTEQYSRNGDLGPWTDIYAIGASLYYAVRYSHTHEHPPAATERSYAHMQGQPDPREPAINIGRGRYSPHFLQAIDWALACMPKDRPQNVQDFQRVLLKEWSGYQSEREIPPPSPPPLPSPPTPAPATPKANTGLVWLGAGAAILTLAGAGLFIWQMQQRHTVELQQQQAAINSVTTEANKNLSAQQAATGALAAVTQIQSVIADAEKAQERAQKAVDAIKAAREQINTAGGQGQNEVATDALIKAQTSAETASNAAQQAQSQLLVAQQAAAEAQKAAENGMPAEAMNYKGAAAGAAEQATFQKKVAEDAADNAEAQMEVAENAASEAVSIARSQPAYSAPASPPVVAAPPVSTAPPSYAQSVPVQQTPPSTQGDIEVAKAAYASGDYGTALRHFQALASGGDMEAMEKLGLMHEQGKGVNEDYTEARRWYQQAAERGHGPAQTSMGRMYHWGRGVSKDHQEAVKWYRQAVGQDDWKGIDWPETYLGNIYSKGDNNVPQDDEEAVIWYRKAAKRGNVDAQARLALFYRDGRGGLSKSEEDAVKWYRKAAEQGHETAQTSLRKMGY